MGFPSAEVESLQGYEVHKGILKFCMISGQLTSCSLMVTMFTVQSLPGVERYVTHPQVAMGFRSAFRLLDQDLETCYICVFFGTT